MKITQNEKPFKPITVVLESQAEVDTFRLLVNTGGRATEDRGVAGLSIAIENHLEQFSQA